VFLDRDGVLNELVPNGFGAVGSPRAAESPAVGLPRAAESPRAVELPLAAGSPRAESPLAVEDVRLIGGAAAAVRDLAQAGYVLVCVSNQPAAAKGEVSIARLSAVHQRLLQLLAAEGAPLDAWRLCLHHPEGVVAELAGACACRKPAPGMLLDAACELSLELSSSWIVGDTDADVLAGRAAGCGTILIEHPGSAHKRSSGMQPDLRAHDLADAVGRLLARS
jgi:D-glycero-D-manno-heptose 1,7-bisphosphate phosphatase